MGDWNWLIVAADAIVLSVELDQMSDHEALGSPAVALAVAAIFRSLDRRNALRAGDPSPANQRSADTWAAVAAQVAGAGRCVTRVNARGCQADLVS